MLIDLPEGHTTVLLKRPLDRDVSFSCSALQACTVRFAAHQLLSMDESRTEIFGFDGAPGLTSGAMRGDSCHDELTPCSDGDDGDD